MDCKIKRYINWYRMFLSWMSSVSPPNLQVQTNHCLWEWIKVGKLTGNSDYSNSLQHHSDITNHRNIDLFFLGGGHSDSESTWLSEDFERQNNGKETSQK